VRKSDVFTRGVSMVDSTGSKESSTGVDVPRSARLLTRLFIVTGSVTFLQLRRNWPGTGGLGRKTSFLWPPRESRWERAVGTMH